MNSTEGAQNLSSHRQTGTPNNQAPAQPAMGDARVPGLWLCMVGGPLFWLFSLGNWVQRNTQSAAYGGTQYTEDWGVKGSSYFLLGSVGGFLVLVGLAAWLAITHRKIPIEAKGVPRMPTWVPLAVAGYGLYAVVRAWVDRADLSQSDFTGGFGGYSSTEVTIPLLLAMLCLIVLAFGAVRYRRGNMLQAGGVTGRAS